MKCHICQSKTSFFLSKDGYDFKECPQCGLIFVDPQPDQKFLAEEVYSKKSGYQKHKVKDLSKTKPDRIRKKILRDIRVLKPNGQLLDVGCSSGEFLYHAKDAGFDVCGVELNSGTADVARTNGLDVRTGTLEDAHFPSASFDIVFLGDIIEHVPDPRAFINESARILKPDGIMVIVTPNLDSRWAKTGRILYLWFNIPWSSLTPPYHLFQFSISNLETLLRGIGFEIKESWFHSPPTLKYELGSLHLWGKYKRERSLRNFLFMLFAFIVYTKLYILNRLISPFSKNDFGMVVLAQTYAPYR